MQVLSFVSEHIQAGEARLAGNSVHVDASFLRRLMPKLHAHLHHRIVDVSTVAELCSRWYPIDAKRMPREKVKHSFSSQLAYTYPSHTMRQLFHRSTFGDRSRSYFACKIFRTRIAKDIT